MSNTSEANVVVIGAVTPHPNADKLELTQINGYQMVIGKGQFNTGDLAVFIQPDSIVPQTEPFKFIWGDHVGIDGKVPDSRRKVTPRRFRKEWSEGLLMPYDEVIPPDHILYAVGSDVAPIIGVTRYVEQFDRESTKAFVASAPRRRYPKSLRGWFFWTLNKLGFSWGFHVLAQDVSFDFPVYDVNAYKNARYKFKEGEQVQITEKIHGCNARFVFVLDTPKSEATFSPLTGEVFGGKFYVGSHAQWKVEGYNVWWNAANQHPEVFRWCVANPGKVLYAEVGPCQKKGKVDFRYGAGKDETFLFTFDVYNPDTQKMTWAGNEGMSLNAPVIYVGPFSEKVMYSFVDGKSTVGDHIREGIVVRSLEDSMRLKVVSNEFFTLK